MSRIKLTQEKCIIPFGEITETRTRIINAINYFVKHQTNLETCFLVHEYSSGISITEYKWRSIYSMEKDVVSVHEVNWEYDVKYT